MSGAGGVRRTPPAPSAGAVVATGRADCEAEWE